MQEIKKGADVAASTPEDKNTEVFLLNKYYSRIKILCLLLHIISFIGFLVSYHNKSVEWMYFWAGILLTTATLHIVIYPIKED